MEEVKLGKNPKLSEMIAWAEQNGLELVIRFGDITPFVFISRRPTKRAADLPKASAKLKKSTRSASR